MFSTFACDSGSEALAYILTGNIVISLLFGTMNSVESRVEWLCFAGGLEFYATLPIQRYMFVLAMVASFLLFSLPSVLVPIMAGTLWLQIPVQLDTVSPANCASVRCTTGRCGGARWHHLFVAHVPKAAQSVHCLPS